MSAGFDLSPELLEAISPGVSKENAQLKFDDAGTLHVLERNADGKLLKDYALKHIEEQINEDAGHSRFDDLELKKKDNSEWKFYFRILLASVSALLVPCVYMVYKGFKIEPSIYITIFVWIACCLSISMYVVVKLIRKYIG